MEENNSAIANSNSTSNKPSNDPSQNGSFVPDTQVSMDTAPRVETELVLGSKLLRYAAAVVDGILTTVILLLLSIPVAVALGTENPIVQILLNVFSIIVGGGYAVIFLKYKNATPGKSFFGLEVIRSDGKAMSWTSAIMREVVGKFLSGIVFMLGYVWILIDKKRQGWHDKIGGTFVVEKQKVGGGKKLIAYLFILLVPVALLGIVATAVLFALNPAQQLQRAKEAQEQFDSRQEILNERMYEFTPPEEAPGKDTFY